MQSVSLHPTHNLKTEHTSKIGSIFKDRRALMSMGEEEVASQTFINIKYIRAIESGDYSAFPARVFALRYYSKYANFLNIQIPFYDLYALNAYQNAYHTQRENKYSPALSWLSKPQIRSL